MLKTELDSWFAKSFDPEEFEFLHTVAFDDHQVLEVYPEYEWVYDKWEISKMLNDEKKHGATYNLGIHETPKKYPVMVKPRINLDGMGKNAMKARTDIGIQAFLGEDYIAQPFVEGVHFSIDFLLFHGQVLEDTNVMVAKKKGGSIVEWKSSPVCPALAWEHAETLAKEMPDYCGAINIEMINDYVLEVHLRPSVCWASIDGGLSQEHYYLSIGEAAAPLELYSPTFEICIRVKKDMAVPRFLPVINMDEYPGVVNTQIIGKPGELLSKEPQDSYSFKLASVQGTSYEDCKAYAIRFQYELERMLMKEIDWL